MQNPQQLKQWRNNRTFEDWHKQLDDNGYVIKRTAKQVHSTLIDGWNAAAKGLS